MKKVPKPYPTKMDIEKQLTMQLELNQTLKERLEYMEKELDMYRQAVGTFESYLQSKGDWDDIKKMKEIIDNNCPTRDVDVLWDNFWGHRCGWDEEPEEEDDQ
jgi:CHAD domain-containing protein